MKLRTKLAALSLLTLLLPWSAWKLLQELERFLRESQQDALLASARAMATAIPMEYSSRLLFLPENFVPVWGLSNPPALDGYFDDWPGDGQGRQFESDDGSLAVRLSAGNHGGRLYILLDVRDDEKAGATDSILLQARSPRGLFSFTISPEAPGPLQLHSDRENSGQVEGFWLEKEDGYRAELALPSSVRNTDISFQVRSESLAAGMPDRVVGPLAGADRPAWISLETAWTGMSRWLDRSGVESARTWLVDSGAWVLADSRSDKAGESGHGTPSTTWLQRLLYRMVAGARTATQETWPENPVRLDGETVRQALTGEEMISWTQDFDTAMVWNTVAVPIELQGEVRGAIVVQSTSDGLLLATNQALGRLLLTTLGIAFGLAAGLWFFATRLSRRVRKLSTAVSQAMQDSAGPEALPLKSGRDELGELARNNQKLLRAVTDYNTYLETLASKLSHELKTPLAITRSSLDNLASKALDEESRQFLQRAQQGVDRQFAIVRAMSEASRLEASISVAEWESIDLGQFVIRCVEAYRNVHEGRALLTEIQAGGAAVRCAPDLLAQALDKLVDNAVSLSGKGDEITVGLCREDAQWALFVRNTGSRLPEDLQERLFDSLVSLRERPGETPHLGLGLYIVRLIAEVHGGEVNAANLPDGAGVEFRITIPV
jgi:dedicated sortase system histidine kinase